MQRRAMLAGLAGGTALVAGCSTSLFTGPTAPSVYNPTGHAAVRPLEEPYLQPGLTTDSEQYLFARLYQTGDSPPVAQMPDATEFADVVATMADDQFALLTNLRTAAGVPAYLWPTETRWIDDRLQIDLTREAKAPLDSGVEAVGVALTVFEVDGEPPAGARIVFPSGATMAVGTSD